MTDTTLYNLAGAAQEALDGHQPKSHARAGLETLAWKVEEARLTEVRDAAVAALIAAPGAARKWDIVEEGYTYDTYIGTAAEALARAREGADRANYGDCDGTIYIDVAIRCPLTGEEEAQTVALDEEEPPCADDHHHEWDSPHSVVGGAQDNPGVWGNGAGHIYREVCRYCGIYRRTDTWAQRHDTGEQGLTEVTYLPADDASLAYASE